jgi:hypothetical protein
MRLHISDMTEFFSWMDSQGYRYVVLRSFSDFDRAYPAHGAKEDIDILVEDRAVAPVYERYRHVSKKSGVKCDIYNVTGAGQGSYLGGSYFPPALAEEVLSSRILWKNLFYVPGAPANLKSLLYHVAYHKAELSKIDIDDPEKSAGSKYISDITSLMHENSVTGVPMTLWGFHRWLAEQGCGVTPDDLARYAYNDFSRKWKCVGMMYCRIAAEWPGEMNLFVIRSVAVKTGRQQDFIRFLREHYQILLVRDIPPLKRLLNGRRMRGGKWRRGGYPAVAVVVYDPHPLPVSAEDRLTQPSVLNSRQFVKREWRDWFTRTTGSKPSANPIHSTDNEAEALAHLPLFFSPHEAEDIRDRLARIRSGQ